jgi:hypothetical protein
MRLYTGDRVKVLASPYGELLGVKAGDTAHVDRAVPGGSTRLVSLRFPGGLRVRAWMVEDNAGNATVKKI